MELSLTSFAPLGERLRGLRGTSLAAQLWRLRFSRRFRRALRRWLAENPEWLPKPIGRMTLKEQLIRAYSIINYITTSPQFYELEAQANAAQLVAANWPEIQAWLVGKVERASSAIREMQEYQGGAEPCEANQDNQRIAALLRSAEAATGMKLELP